MWYRLILNFRHHILDITLPETLPFSPSSFKQTREGVIEATGRLDCLGGGVMGKRAVGEFKRIFFKSGAPSIPDYGLLRQFTRRSLDASIPRSLDSFIPRSGRWRHFSFASGFCCSAQVIIRPILNEIEVKTYKLCVCVLRDFLTSHVGPSFNHSVIHLSIGRSIILSFFNAIMGVFHVNAPAQMLD